MSPALTIVLDVALRMRDVDITIDHYMLYPAVSKFVPQRAVVQLALGEWLVCRLSFLGWP